ncbi:MAG: hypothetical protein EP343_00255 [Deltaproteobacteria bacterium]|nr:MAG: hypothetical protein EP343_00255 [Deltaproteobacteria bacterium]
MREAMITQARSSQLVPSHKQQPKVAVLLNGNARRVTRRLLKKLERHIPREHIYYSTTMEEAHQCCEALYRGSYDVVFTGGGDGTLMNCVTELQRFHDEDPTPKPLPVLGVLHLGTGNAVASTLSADSRITPDIEQARSGQGFDIKRQRWVVANGKRAPFAGFGYDSMILNHYQRVKSSTANTMFASLGQGGLGYFFAISCLSIPATLFRKRPVVEVINEGSTAYLLGPDGQPVKEFAPGEVMYEGETSLVGAGTVPCFGYNFRIFPFATSGNHMNLRIANVSSLEAVANLPSLWRGTWRHPRLFDFHVDNVRIRFQDEQPLQIGGDAVGFAKETVFSLSQEHTFLADLSAARNRPALQPMPA